MFAPVGSRSSNRYSLAARKASTSSCIDGPEAASPVSASNRPTRILELSARRWLSVSRLAWNRSRQSGLRSRSSARMDDVARIEAAVDSTSCTDAARLGSCASRSLSVSTVRSSVAMRRCAAARASAQPGKRPANSSTRSASGVLMFWRAAASRNVAISAASAPSVSIDGSTPRAAAMSSNSLPPILRRLCSIRLRYEADIPIWRARSACLRPAIIRRSRIRVPANASRATRPSCVATEIYVVFQWLSAPQRKYLYNAYHRIVQMFTK